MCKKKKRRKTMENTADFTQKELCLLLSTVCENELGVILVKNMKDLRAKDDIFQGGQDVIVSRHRNKQGKTRVSVFQTSYLDKKGDVKHAYTTTL